GGNFILCSSDSPNTISANTSGLGNNSVTSYAWSINSSSISNSSSTLSVSPNLSTNPQIVSCIVTLSNSNTISDTVKVYTIYPGTISSVIQIACNSSGYDPSLFGSTDNGTTSLNGVPNFSYSYQWQISTDNINWINISNTNSATYDSPQITTTSYFRRSIIVSIGNGNNSITTTCYSNIIDVQVLTPPTINANQCIASNSTGTMTVNFLPSLPNGFSANYAWSGPNSFSSNIEVASVSNFSASNIGVYNANINVIYGTAICNYPLSTQLNLFPNTPTFSIPANGCPGTSYSYSPSNFTPQAGTSYVWTVSPSSNSTGLTTNSPSFIFNNGGLYSVSVTATTQNGCTATSAVQNVSVINLTNILPSVVGSQALQVINGVNTLAICSGSSTSNAIVFNDNFGGTNPTNTIYTYTINGGIPTAITGSATVPINYGNNTFILTATSGVCTLSNSVNLYSGSNPYVSLGANNSINLCPGSTVNFVIDPTQSVGFTNPPGTTYTLTLSDIVGNTIYTDLINDITVPHSFNTTSCGITNSGTTFPPNTYYALVTAQNPCGTSQSFYSPITVHNLPTANFTVSDSTLCTGQSATITNTGVSGSVVGNNSPYNCTAQGKFYWQITGGVLGTNFTLAAGQQLGSFCPPPTCSWNSTASNGSSTLNITFLTAGYYTITQVYYNQCGQKTFTRNICVIDPPTCQFTVNPNSGCTPLTVNINNTTIAPTCGGTPIPLSYAWTITSPNGTSSSYTSNSSQVPPALTLTNPTTTPQTFTISLVVNPKDPYNISQNFGNPNCVSNCSQTVTVNPIPIFTPFNITSCVSPYQANVNLQTSTNMTSTFTWIASSNTNVTGESTTTQSTPIIGDLLTNTSSLYQTINYTVTPTSNLNCVGQTVTSSTITINYVTPGTIATDQTICSGTIPATITSSSPASGYGTFCYQWQQSTDNINWTNLGSCLSTNTTYSPGVLTQNTYFRRVVNYLSNGTTCSTFSNTILISINSLTAPTISASQNICAGNDPTVLTISSPATGTALTYQWQSSITSSSTGFTNISNQTGLSYDPPVLTVNTWYKVIVTSTLNGLPCSANSNVVLISVYIFSPGSIGNNQTICTGGDPNPFTATPGSSTGTIILTYQWQLSLDNISWSNILNATSTNYDPGVLSTTTFFRRVVIATFSGTAICQDYSNVLSITVVPDPIINIQSPDQSLCIGGIPSAISLSLTGGIGTTYTYQWHSSSLNSNTGGTLITISGTAQSYSPPSFNILNNTYYYCVVSQLGLGCGVSTNPILISFVSDPIVTAPLGASYCQNSATVVPLSVSALGGS
ncbi:MAG: hypothetical protein EBR35_06445, partial [Flavobacteriales bacterium]|nr:hypothetical protein [Flavobacteriales bacterium]